MSILSTMSPAQAKHQLDVWVASTESDWHDVLRIRRRVFLREQGLVDVVSRDRDDRNSVTLLAAVDNITVATGRLTGPIGKQPASIAWVATLPDYRRLGAANLVVAELVSLADRAGFDPLILNAQIPAIALYERYGFRAKGEGTRSRGIAHQLMVRETPRIPVDL